MLARGTSPPRDDTPISTAIPLHPTQPLHNNKKRKRDGHYAATASPAPSELGTSSLNPAENVVLPSYHDLASRPRLSIARGPVFIPSAEGSEYHNVEQLATNRIGFRYMPAGIKPPGSSMPFRTIESAPAAYRISWEDRSPHIKVTQDGLALLGDKGFRSARGNAPVREGKWYMEVAIEQGGGERAPDSGRQQGAHVRLGWGRREASLNAPCGLDGYSYGLRDKTGEKVTLSRPRPYGVPFGTGDVVGMYISLPPLRKPAPNDPNDPAHIKRERIAIEFKGQEYFESLEYPQSKEMLALMDEQRKPAIDAAPVPSAPKTAATAKSAPGRAAQTTTALRSLPILPGSTIAFFVNGRCMGTAFRDIHDFIPLRAPADARKSRERKRAREGAREHKENPFDDGCLGYYPFISLFNDARVRLNPGPDFKFPPPPDIDALLDGAPDAMPIDSKERTWRPICDRYAEFMDEQWALDVIEEEEAKIEAAQREETERIEEAKKADRERKRAQAEARKRAKREAEAAAFAAANPTPPPPPTPTPVVEPKREESAAPPDEDRFGPGMDLAPDTITWYGPGPPASPEPAPSYELTPSHSMAWEPVAGSASNHVDSPAPTVASAMESLGIHSGYNSEYDAAKEEEEEEDAPSGYTHVVGPGYGDSAHYQHTSGAPVRMELEEGEEEQSAT